MSGGCIFCKIVRGEIPARKVHEDDALLAFHDVSPQAPVHVLVIPKDHVPTLDDLGPEHETLLGRIGLTIPRIARDLGLSDDGYRVVANCRAKAGQSVFHIHFHILGGRVMNWPPG